MTAHWIHIEGSPLAPTWELWHLVLGSSSMEEFANWPSRCAYSLHAFVTCRISPLLVTFPNCCIVVYLQSLLGLLWNNAVCSNCMWTSLLLSPIVGATSPRLSTPPFNGIGFAVDAISYTMWWMQGWRAWMTMPLIPHKPLLQWYRRRWTSQYCCLFIALLDKWFAYCANEHACNVLHSWMDSSCIFLVKWIFASCMGHCPYLWFPTYFSMFLYPIFSNLVCFGIGLKRHPWGDSPHHKPWSW